MEYLDMGGRAWFVWPAYAISVLALGALVYMSWQRMRTAERQVRMLERGIKDA